jgi:replication factor A1
MAHYNGPPLSRGSLRALVGGATELHPVLQVIDVKQIGAAGGGGGAPAAERFRLIMSDGEHYQQAMLATQLNELVKRGEVVRHSVVRVDECVPRA